jgi:hypothetical protein
MEIIVQDAHEKDQQAEIRRVAERTNAKRH